MIFLFFLLLYYLGTEVFLFPILTIFLWPLGLLRLVIDFTKGKFTKKDILLCILISIIDINLLPFYLVSDILYTSIRRHKFIVIFSLIITLSYLVVAEWDKFTAFLLFEQLTVLGHVYSVILFVSIEMLSSGRSKFFLHILVLALFSLMTARTGFILFLALILFRYINDRNLWIGIVGLGFAIPFLFVYVENGGSSDYYRLSTINTLFNLVFNGLDYDTYYVSSLMRVQDIEISRDKVLFDNTYLTLYYRGVFEFYAGILFTIICSPRILLFLVLDDYTNGLLISIISIYLQHISYEKEYISNST